MQTQQFYLHQNLMQKQNGNLVGTAVTRFKPLDVCCGMLKLLLSTVYMDGRSWLSSWLTEAEAPPQRSMLSVA